MALLPVSCLDLSGGELFTVPHRFKKNVINQLQMHIITVKRAL